MLGWVCGKSLFTGITGNFSLNCGWLQAPVGDGVVYCSDELWFSRTIYCLYRGSLVVVEADVPGRAYCTIMEWWSQLCAITVLVVPTMLVLCGRVKCSIAFSREPRRSVLGDILLHEDLEFWPKNGEEFRVVVDTELNSVLKARNP
ncbi:hypothetical protein VNO77_40642 [Canavalia gladiata]|uniref:Uncharacterized protein n=1 Tax=Canavalia gladiata TaxID=3824 RepID=A0AAN9K021_CANGL